MQDRDERLGNETALAVREIYRPILRGYFAAWALYYTAMIAPNVMGLTGLDLVLLQGATVLAAGLAVFGIWYMRKPALAQRVDLLLLIMNVVVISNIVIALNINFAAEKITYFIIIAIAFGLGSVNLKQSLLSIFITGIALATFMPLLDETTLKNYTFITFGSAVSSVAIAYLMRKAITKIAEAKIAAEDKLRDAKALSEDLLEQSLSDSLTKLPNRRAFFRMLKGAIRRVRSSRGRADADEHVWLILMDLDGFKAVNDIHGHITGDLLLQQVAGRLERVAGNDMHVSRMGGDEFNLIYVGNDDPTEIITRCELLLAEISQTYFIDGRHVAISCSLGLTKLEPGTTSRSQINHADYALMVAKKKGKNCLVLFDEEHAQEADARFQIENALRNSDLEKEIGVVFQPQFAIGSPTVARAEVLVRWDNPDVGYISPQRFIQIAEESGLITGVTLTVVEKALAELISWPTPVPLSINLSSYDLISDPTIDQIIALVEKYGIEPSFVEFEVTETAMMADIGKATANLERMTQLGFPIALDDFGTGYSNFSYLRSLPIQKLKVDKSFIENPSDPMTEKVLASLVGMARVLGVHCLLEGVEDEVGLLMAKRAGAESVQGYLLGKPMSSANLIELVQQGDDEGDANGSDAALAALTG